MQHRSPATLTLPLTPVHALLVAAVLMEFLVMRVLLRIGPLLPENALWDTVFGWLQTIGLGAINLVVVVTISLLVWEGVQARRAGEGRQSFAVTLCMFTAMVLTILSVVDMGSTSLLASALGIGASATALLTLPVQDPRKQLFQGLLALIMLALTGYYGVKGAAGLGMHFPDSAAVYFLLEWLAVAAGLAVPFVFHPGWLPKTAAMAALVAILWATLFWLRPWTLATLVMWNTGFSLWLPSPFYAVGLGCFLYTMAGLAQGGPPEKRAALGLLLLGAAGLKLDYSPYALMALLGCFLLATSSGFAGQITISPAQSSRLLLEAAQK